MVSYEATFRKLQEVAKFRKRNFPLLLYVLRNVNMIYHKMLALLVTAVSRSFICYISIWMTILPFPLL
jgi:hypothetical protein